MKKITALALALVASAMLLASCGSPEPEPEPVSQAELSVTVNIPKSSDALASPAIVAVEPTDSSENLPSAAWAASHQDPQHAVMLPPGKYSVSLICPVDMDGTVYAPVMPVEVALPRNGLSLEISPGQPIAPDRVSNDLVLGMAVAAQRCRDIDPSVPESAVQALFDMAENGPGSASSRENALSRKTNPVSAPCTHRRAYTPYPETRNAPSSLKRGPKAPTE